MQQVFLLALAAGALALPQNPYGQYAGESSFKVKCWVGLGVLVNLNIDWFGSAAPSLGLT